jgi:hypothetical protein
VIKLLGFAPDSDPTTPGVMTACTNVIPTVGGFRGAPVAASVGASALAAACQGATLLTSLDGTRRLIAGTATKLYELAGASWTDRSRGANYSIGSDRWSIVQYANTTLAVTPSAVVQSSTTGAFADVASSPQAKIVESAQGFAVVFNTSSYSDEWYCCAQYDPSDWALSVTTQCVKGRLVGSPGPITAAKRFGDKIVAYKLGSMYLGSYVGAPEVWRWDQVSTDVGCVGQDSVVDTPAGHIFMGADSLYVFDGTTPRQIGAGVIRDWLVRDMIGAYQFKATLLFDRGNMLVWVYYPGAGSTAGALNRCTVYDITNNRFGCADSEIEAVLSYSTGAVTYTAGSPSITTYASATGIPYNSPFWISGAVTPAVFNTSHVLSTLSGANSSGSFTSGDLGDDEGYRMCRALRVRYTAKPTTSTCTGYVKDESGATVATGSSASVNDGRHDMRQTARWHRFKVDTTGDFEATGIRPEFVETGKR